jgi:D-alanyl-D-alanine carboxypeptidase
VLVGVSGLVLQSAFAPPRRPEMAAVAEAATQPADQAVPAPASPPGQPGWVVQALATPDAAPLLPADPPLPADPAAPADPTQAPATPTPWPAAGLPNWLRSLQDTTLWDGPADGAAVRMPFASGGYLKTLGPIIGSRVLVYSVGDGGASAGQGWVDTRAVQPSELPPWLGGPPPSGGVAALARPPVKATEPDPVPPVSAQHVAILDDASGQLLYGDDEHAQVPEASVTKIATTIVALEREPDLGRTLTTTVSASEMVNRDGSSVMGLEPGQRVSLATLLYGMMLPSGNDAAEQVAVGLAGSRDAYVDWMNQEVAALGLKDTHFVNPSGMDAPGHYSSAFDMAMLARYAMRNDTFRTLASAKTYTGDGFGPMRNLNRLLGYYAGADGVKIGYTDNAHKTFVASVTRDGHRVYVSLMHSEDLVTDSIRLFDWVWANYTWP